jgi:hypothetical protein
LEKWGEGLSKLGENDVLFFVVFFTLSILKSKKLASADRRLISGP